MGIESHTVDRRSLTFECRDHLQSAEGRHGFTHHVVAPIAALGDEIAPPLVTDLMPIERHIEVGVELSAVSRNESRHAGAIKRGVLGDGVWHFDN